MRKMSRRKEEILELIQKMLKGGGGKGKKSKEGSKKEVIMICHQFVFLRLVGWGQGLNSRAQTAQQSPSYLTCLLQLPNFAHP